jgi:hypothetical protein
MGRECVVCGPEGAIRMHSRAADAHAGGTEAEARVSPGGPRAAENTLTRRVTGKRLDYALGSAKFTVTLVKPSACSMLSSIARVFSCARATSPEPCCAAAVILCCAMA